MTEGIQYFEDWFAQLLLFVVGDLIGLAFLRFAFNWALIIVSVLGGAALVMQGLPDLFNQESGAITALVGLVVAIVLAWLHKVRRYGRPAERPEDSIRIKS